MRQRTSRRSSLSFSCHCEHNEASSRNRARTTRLLRCSGPRNDKTASSGDDTLVAEMQASELSVCLFETGNRDRRGGPSGGAAHLRDPVLEPVREIDADAMLVASHRVADRLTDRLNDTGHPDAPAPCLDIDIECDRLDQRLQL